MNIAIIGIGGIGGCYGGKIAKAYENDKDVNVYFLARGEHLQAIQKNGLSVKTSDGEFCCRPSLASSNPIDFEELDFVLFCTKGYDLKDALLSIKSKITKNTIIMPLLNGVDIYEQIKQIVDLGYVLPACVYIGAHIEKYGFVVQDGGAGNILFGNDSNNPLAESQIDKIKAVFEKANIPFVYNKDNSAAIWEKYLFIASYALVTARFNMSIGQVLENEEALKTLNGIVEEIYALSKKAKIDLPDDIVSKTVAKGKNFAFETKTSFQRDFEISSKKDERDLFGGAILSLAKKYDVNVPVSSKVFSELNAKKTQPL